MKRIALQKGQQFFRKGEYSAAAIQFQKVLQADATSGEAYLWLGRTEGRLGNFSEAYAGLTRAVELLPGQNAAKVELANLMLVAYLNNSGRPGGLYAGISRIAADLLAQDQKSFDGNRLLGQLAMADGRPAQAVPYFEIANGVKPNQSDVITAYVESLARSGRQDRAEQIARDFLRINPTFGPLYTLLHQEYMKAGRLRDAEDILQAKVAHNPGQSLYRIELARHYARVGRKPEMLETLNQLVSHPKDFPEAWLDAGDFYAESKDWAQARGYYETGAQRDPRRQVMYWKRIARVDIAGNDSPAAQQILDRILKDQPDDVEARASRAALRMAGQDAGNKKLALADFRKLVDDSPGKADYRFQYAEALRLNGETEAAQAQYSQVIRLQPRNLAALQALADFSIRAQRTDEALVYATQVLAIDPGNVRARLVQSAALASKGRFAETRPVLDGLIREHPELKEAQLQLALLDVEEKHYAPAEARFRKYYRPGEGDVRSLEGLVEIYRAQNRLDKAVVLLKQDLEKGAPSNDVRVLLAMTAAQAGQTDLAVAEYEEAARSEPNSARVAVGLGLACQARGDLTRAISELGRAEKLEPGNAMIYAYLGKVLEESGRKTEAIATYRKSLSRDARNPWVMNNLAYLLADTGGDLNEALKLAEAAARQSPDNTAFSDTVGWVYFRKKDFASAIQVFSGARDKNPKEVEFRIHLSQALLANGNRSQVRGELEAAQALARTPQQSVTIARLLTESGPAR